MKDLLRDLGGLNLGREKLFRVILMLTNQCRLRCRTCGIWKSERVLEPSFAELEAFFSKNRVSWLNLTGGEIFLRKDLPRIFRLIARTQPHLGYLSFPTSGWFVEPVLEGVKSALDAGIGRLAVTVSFDGGRASHNALRGREGAFDRARKTFHALKDLSTHRLKVVPGMTLSAALLGRGGDPLEELVRDLDLQGTHEIHVNLAHASPHYYENGEIEPPPPPETLELVHRLGRSRAGRIGSMDLLERLYLKGARRYLVTGKTPLRCKALRASVFIDAGWNVYPCTVHPRALCDLKALGFDLARAASTPEFAEAKAEIDRGGCPGCWTPCEAYTAIIGSLFRPSLLRLALERSG